MRKGLNGSEEETKEEHQEGRKDNLEEENDGQEEG